MFKSDKQSLTRDKGPGIMDECLKEMSIISIYKTEIMKMISNETKLSQRIVSDVMNEWLKQMTATLARGETVTFPGFGTFYTRQRPQSRAVDFSTGKPLRVPARRVASFRVGELLKRAVRRK
jgi:DNA-binding protein HU-beta